MRRALFVLISLVTPLIGAAVGPAKAVSGTAATIMVIDADAGLDMNGALFAVDAETGARVLVSDFGRSSQGATGKDPVGLTIDATSKTAFVVDRGAGTGSRGALFRIAPATGDRTLLSDLGDRRQGPTGSRPTGVAVEASGAILVVDPTAGRGLQGALFRVDAITGARKLLSDFGDESQGPGGDDPSRIAVESSGAILISDPSVGAGGALFRVDADTGRRVILSDFGDPSQGPTGTGPAGIAVESSGAILVVDSSAGLDLSGALFRVNPVTGARVLLSDFGNPAQGIVGNSPADVAVGPAGVVLVTDPTLGLGGALFRVDPATGDRTLLSDFDVAVQGPAGDSPTGVASVSLSAEQPLQPTRIEVNGPRRTVSR